MVEIPKGSLVQPKDSYHYEIMIFNTNDDENFNLIKIKNSVVSNKEIFEQVSSQEFYKTLMVFEIINNIINQELDPKDVIIQIATAFNLNPIFLHEDAISRSETTGYSAPSAPFPPLTNLIAKCYCGKEDTGECGSTQCPKRLMIRFSSIDSPTFEGSDPFGFYNLKKNGH
jgi:hypothetical protein